MKRIDLVVIGTALFLLSGTVSSISFAVEGIKGQPVRSESVEFLPGTDEPEDDYTPLEKFTVVDLNDYLGDPEDDTDYNCTDIGDEEELVLKANGIYFDETLNCWCKTSDQL